MWTLKAPANLSDTLKEESFSRNEIINVACAINSGQVVFGHFARCGAVPS